MEHLQQSFSVRFQYDVYFSNGIFQTSNKLFENFLKERSVASAVQKILFVIDEAVAKTHPLLENEIDLYFKNDAFISLVKEKVIIAGGEEAKNDPKYFNQILDAVNLHGIDRHSYIAAIGGGSVLDLAGYVSAISHRGIKHIRIPTTVLSQNDSGVGVKNGINYFGKKNFLGTFAPPVAVFNDFTFLQSLSERDWRSGISEAIKVALIKDPVFFEWIESHADKLIERSGNNDAMNYLIHRCAELHLEHIRSLDPFESGSSRPLDFGHWSAHKLEQLTHFEVFHGEAVAMGIALDTIYSTISGRLAADKAERIIQLLLKLGLPVTHPLMQPDHEQSAVLLGLQEFREHLGGRLTIMLLQDIGKGEEVHEIDPSLVIKAGQQLKKRF
jgi:3-dehydroquinate synthase